MTEEPVGGTQKYTENTQIYTIRESTEIRKTNKKDTET